MAESFLVATGSKKISQLSTISAISQSAVIPVVMGSSYPITNGNTNQISYEDFRSSVILNNPNIFTTTQIVRVGSGNNQQQTSLEGHDFIMSTGSLVTPVGTEGFKIQLFANDGTPGAKLYTYDNTEAVAANRFKTFMEIGTGYGDVTFTRPVSFGSALTVNNNLVVNGVLTARQVQTSIVTSSVQYESGSTKFGDTFEDTHEFTGSLKVSGSLALNTLTQNRIVLVGANGILNDSSALTFNGTTLSVGSNFFLNQSNGNITTTGYLLINGNGARIDGTINNPLIGAVTSSLINIVGGLQAYTASLKTAAIVSSSQQILNYNIFATTGSNTFRADQAITGSLSISAGEFNVITGSGAMTSSLRFDHTQNDGATLQLSNDNNTALSDHAFNVTVKSAGVYTEFVRNGTPYSILNVEAFDDNKIYLYRDTRLYNKSLVIDNNLTVTDDAQITGSLIVVGGITGSLLATNGVVSSSNQLFELNNQTGSQNGVNLGISIVTASLNAFTASTATSTTNINSFTASQLTVNTLTQAVTSSLITIVGGVQAYTASLKGQAIVSSSTQIENYNLFALDASVAVKTSGSTLYTTNPATNNFNQVNSIFLGSAAGQNATSAQSSVFLGVSAGIQATSAQESTFIGNSAGAFATNALRSNFLGINAGASAVNAVNSNFIGYAAGEGSTNASYSTIIGHLAGRKWFGNGIGTNNIIIGTGVTLENDRRDSINLGGIIFATGSYGNTIGNPFSGSVGNGRVGINKVLPSFELDIIGSAGITGSLNVSGGITGSILSTNNVVSSSQQILNYNLFAVTASNNSFYGENTFTNKVTHTNGFVVLTQVSQSLNFADDTAAAAGGVPLGGLYRNGNFIAIRID